MDHQNGNQSYSPYAAPTADTRLTSRMGEAFFIPGGRSVSAGTAFSWISSSWELFKQAPGKWIGFIITVIALSIILDYIPDSVSITIFGFIDFLLSAGIVYSCFLLRKEGAFSFGDLFIAFQRKTGSLLISFLIPFVFFFVLVIFFLFLFDGINFLKWFEVANKTIEEADNMNEAALYFNLILQPALLKIISTKMIIGGFMVLVGWIIFSMAIWFAPALVLMHDMVPFEAVKMSFFACLKNLLPGIVFFIVAYMLMLISALPLLLGLLVTVPMFYICGYTSYHSIFLDEKKIES
ncbi:MAG: hypothetical protein FWH56_10045 [Betaproteobacteria bacterium]|nr:hypothetical protein [Betaproteobacteria bacterium]